MKLKAVTKKKLQLGKLAGKVTFITGAGSGMGKAQAMLFAKEGTKVIVGDINFENVKELVDNIKADGGTALAVEIDVANKESIHAAVEK